MVDHCATSRSSLPQNGEDLGDSICLSPKDETFEKPPENPRHWESAKTQSFPASVSAKHQHAIAVSVSDGHTESIDSDKHERPSHVSLPRSMRMRLGRLFSTLAPQHSISMGQRESKERIPWRTTLIRFGPLSGFFCMLLAIASIVASLGILAGSNGQAVSNWSVPPSTYLAIFTAVANLSMRYAVVQGVILAWWSRASKGSTLANLHWDWRAGTSLRGALTAGRHMGLLGLACIFSTVVVIGPLLQRSSTVITAPLINQTVSLDISMAPQIPTEFSGTWSTTAEEGIAGLPFSPAWNNTMPTNNGSMPNNIVPNPLPFFDDVSIAWWANAPLQGVVRGCPGGSVCSAKLIGPTLWPTCTTHQASVDYLTYVNSEALFEEIYAPPLSNDGFLISAGLNLEGEQETINLISGFASTDNCKGTLNYTICSLESATGEYEVSIHGNSIVMQDLKMPALISRASNAAINRTTAPGETFQFSTLGGIAAGAYLRWNVLISYFLNKNGSPDGIEFGPPTWEQYRQPSGPTCSSFNDPLPDILRSLNQLMLFGGAAAARYTAEGSGTDETYLRSRMDTDLPANYTISGHVQGKHAIYTTDYSYFAGAAIVEMICILLVLPTYWGWWKLGRSMSFSPLELAKAFESPLLSEYPSNSSGRSLANATTSHPVQYGVKNVDEASKDVKLAFGSPASVDVPRSGMSFDI